MRIGLVEFLLILAIASLTIGPQVALFVDRWMRRANRAKEVKILRTRNSAKNLAKISATEAILKQTMNSVTQ